MISYANDKFNNMGLSPRLKMQVLITYITVLYIFERELNQQQIEEDSSESSQINYNTLIHK